MADFKTAYAPLKRHEGGWCNISGDAGGETYAGISRKFFASWPGWQIVDAAKAHSMFTEGAKAFSRHLSAIPGLSDMVEEWYRAEWWEAMQLGQFPQAVASELFEQAVNLGRAGSGRYLQRLCNAFNRGKGGQPLFADLVEDGAVGPKTLGALAAILRQRSSEAAVVHALNCLQGAHYLKLAADSPTQRQFLDGWMTRTHCNPAESGT